MDINSLKQYLTFQGKLLGVDTTDLAEYINFCIDSGSNDLWNRGNWSFRTRSYTLSTTDGTGTYTMPDDFEGILSARETGSLSGNDIDCYLKEEYDSMFPKPSAHIEGYPAAMAFYWDKDKKAWKVDLFPRPTGVISIEMQIATRKPPSIAAFPEKAEGALIASCLRFFHTSGSGARVAAFNEYEAEVRKLEVSDQPFKGKLWKVKDDTDTTVEVFRPWL